MNLSALHNGEKGVIVKVKGHGAFRKRITEMGFVKGKEVTVVKNAPLKDPIEYSILDYHISLRRSEATLIEVITIKEADKHELSASFEGVFDGDLLRQKAIEKRKNINVALVGNPNCGKTTLFNIASGSKEHVGNYSGVTIDSKIAKFKFQDYTFNITDLPGTYSLSAYTPEELFVREHILTRVPDIVVNVVDASNLERNLYLTTQLIDMDLRVVVALNMYDELEKRGASFDAEALGRMLGAPFIPTIGTRGVGMDLLFEKIIEVYDNKSPELRHVHINYGKTVEKGIQEVQELVRENKNIEAQYSPRYISVKLLEKDSSIEGLLKMKPNFQQIKETSNRQIENIEQIFSEDSETAITDARYGFIAGALKETYKENAVVRQRKSHLIDNFITHKLFGFPVFLFFMFIMFFATFQLGQFPMTWIESLVAFIGGSIDKLMAEGPFKDLLIDGVIGGVGGVIVFLPNILILFLFISFMEDTGYMARAAFIMDKLMHRIGLHGKSFIPLIMGFGCNVPAIMSTRTIENKNDRILTILINPFMSCSARLPVYILIIGAFFPENPSSMLFLVYIIGIFMAIVVARIFKKAFFSSDEAPFVMELPPYRMPTLKGTIRHMWDKGFQYLKKMGGIILVGSIIIWALGYYPRTVDYSQDYVQQAELLQQELKVTDNADAKLQMRAELDFVKQEMKMEQQEFSYIGRIGKFIQPAMEPLGFDWKISVSLLAGVTAKEIVISTMGVLFMSDGDNGENIGSLQEKLKNERHQYGERKGEYVFTPLVAFTFLMFILIYFPCIAVIAAVKKEAGSWKWAVFTIVYTTALAWIVAFIVNKTGSILF
jgi:ferrous iron transport protein B